MAFTQKSSSVIQRVEGDLPPIPDTVGKDLKAWWSEATAVLDRVRDKIDDIESSTQTSTTTVTATTTTGASTSYGTTFSNSDKSKLDGIEIGATGDLSAEEIKALYESNGDTNAFTDAHLSNLQSLINTADESSSSSSSSDRQIARAASPSTSDRYLFTANTNEAQWIIDHQLGFLPNVQVYDSDLDEIEADIKHTDQYQTIINFTGTTTGYAVLS